MRGRSSVYVGNVSASLVRVGELFRDAVRLDASGVVLVHNHPSGDPTPSPDDLHLTAEAIAADRQPPVKERSGRRLSSPWWPRYRPG